MEAPMAADASTARSGHQPAPAGLDAARTVAWGSHPVDLRLSIPLPFGRYYVTIIAGKERRGGERRATERRRHPILRFANIAVLVAIGSILGLAGLALVQLATVGVLQRSGVLAWLS